MPGADTRLTDEWKLLIISDSCPLFKERAKQWDIHTTLYTNLQTQSASGNTSWGEKRISFLFGNLTIIDSKLGKLLTFNQLLLAAMTFLFVALYNEAKRLPPTDHGLARILIIVLLVFNACFWNAVAWHHRNMPLGRTATCLGGFGAAWGWNADNA